jgi:hypothetical protein
MQMQNPSGLVVQQQYSLSIFEPLHLDVILFLALGPSFHLQNSNNLPCSVPSPLCLCTSVENAELVTFFIM